MILRRVIAHFRKQEWTAIAIEFLIAVAGVAIGAEAAARRNQSQLQFLSTAPPGISPSPGNACGRRRRSG